MPWRLPEADGHFDPYKILVSEIMLQQTQVHRVIPKFQTFIERFPTYQDLAAAGLADVLVAWSGLGYNRRAKYLHMAAKQIQATGWPKNHQELMSLPGVGANTAAAIMVYAYNQPIAFIETNIRTVFIHFYFQDRDDVADREILPLVEQTLDREHPREWFWALMDYGAHLKRHVGNISRLSRHYNKQSNFNGSTRQIRGAVLRLLTTKPATWRQIAEIIQDERVTVVLQDLQNEGLITKAGQSYRLPG